MKITISEVSGIGEGILALGLAQLGRMVTDGSMPMQTSVDILGGGMPPAKPAPVATPAPLAIAPVQDKPARKKAAAKTTARKVAHETPAKVAKPVVKPARSEGGSGDNPSRLTIRGRIAEILKEGPMGSIAMAAALRSQGVAIDVKNAGQHMYLMTQDKMLIRDNEAGTWRLAA